MWYVKSFTIDDVAYISKTPKYHVAWRASSVNCLVPGSKFYLFKPSDNNEAQHWRSAGHKCYNNARMDMPKGNPVVTKNIFLPLDSSRHQQRIQKTCLL